jgi:flavodoxin
MKKNIIVYASKTGNTEKVAMGIARGFEKHGWHNDLKKLPEDYDVENPNFRFDDYDFACVGSFVYGALPAPQIRKVVYGKPESRKITPGPKCGLVFCTYGGMHLGPKEAEPTLKHLEVDLMHQAFQVIGSLAIPGNMAGKDSTNWYFPDLINRPDGRDMKNVALFVDDVMKKLKDYPYYQTQ